MIVRPTYDDICSHDQGTDRTADNDSRAQDQGIVNQRPTSEIEKIKETVA